jgi:hypothetical protein
MPGVFRHDSNCEFRLDRDGHPTPGLTLTADSTIEATGVLQGAGAISGVTETFECFRAGSQIATPAGTVPVERLAVGDRVLTYAGEVRRIIWADHRTIDCRVHPQAFPYQAFPYVADPDFTGYVRSGPTVPRFVSLAGPRGICGRRADSDPVPDQWEDDPSGHDRSRDLSPKSERLVAYFTIGHSDAEIGR